MKVRQGPFRIEAAGQRVQLLQLFQEEELGADPDAIYREYVGYSSTCNVVRQMEQQGSRLEDCRLASLLCQMGSGFQLR